MSLQSQATTVTLFRVTMGVIMDEYFLIIIIDILAEIPEKYNKTLFA